MTLSRELSCDEIARIHDAVDIDLEGFRPRLHLLQLLGGVPALELACRGRSANRGMCAQPCRLPYTLEDAAGRVLSPAGRTLR